MKKVLRFSEVSASRQALIRLCQVMNYGQIRCLAVRNADPVFATPLQLLVDVRLDCAEEIRPEINLADFSLPVEVCRLFDRLDKMPNALIDSIEVRGGVARRVIFKATDLLGASAAESAR